MVESQNSKYKQALTLMRHHQHEMKILSNRSNETAAQSIIELEENVERLELQLKGAKGEMFALKVDREEKGMNLRVAKKTIEKLEVERAKFVCVNCKKITNVTEKIDEQLGKLRERREKLSGMRSRNGNDDSNLSLILGEIDKAIVQLQEKREKEHQTSI